MGEPPDGTLFLTGFGKKERSPEAFFIKPLQFLRKTDILCVAVCVMKIGSCAILRREPCQVLTEAAVSVRRMCCGVARSERRGFCLP